MAGRTPRLRTQAEAVAAPPIAPEEFHRIARGVEILGISLEDCEVHMVDRNLVNGSRIAIEYAAQFVNHVAQEDGLNYVSVLQAGTVLAHQDEKVAFSIAVGFRLVYRTPEPFTEAFFDVFKNTTLLLNAVPYLREFVSATCIRLGVPVIMLPMFRPNFADEPTEQVQPSEQSQTAPKKKASQPAKRRPSSRQGDPP